MPSITRRKRLELRRADQFEYIRKRYCLDAQYLARDYGWFCRERRHGPYSTYMKFRSGVDGSKITVRISDHPSSKFKANNLTSFNVYVHAAHSGFDLVAERLMSVNIAPWQKKCLWLYWLRRFFLWVLDIRVIS